MEQIIFSHKKLIKRFLIYAVIILVSSSVNSFPSYASSLMGIDGQFDGLSGDAKYAGKEYRDNYQLDIEHLGLTEAGTKMMADFSNGIWMVIYNFAFLAIAVFYQAMTLDFAKILADQIQTIQAALHDSVFQPLLMIAIIGTFSIIVLKYARRDFSGLIGEFGKIFFIMILSVWLVKDSAGLLSGATNITKGLSTSVLSELANVDVGSDVEGIKLGNGTDLYAQQASGVLWVSLIHQSWLSLEFGNYKPSEEEVEQFLTADTADKREELVKKVMEDNPKVFSKDRIAGRIAQASIMLILIVVKSVIYGALGVLQIFLQIIAIACVLLASFILFLALIPSYGFDLLGLWAKKIFETQLAVLLLTFLMGFMILISNIISSISGSLGWMVGLVLEVAIGVGLFKFRSQIFAMFTSAGKAGKLVLHPSALKHALEYGMSPSDFYPGFGADGPLRRRNRRYSGYQNGYDEGDYYDDYPAESDYSGNRAPVSNQTAISKPLTYNQEASAIQPQDEHGSYYASYEESSNWRDQWYSAERPTTKTEKSMKRAPIKADSLPNLDNNISESISENQVEGMRNVKRPLSVQELHEVESADDGQQVLGTESSMKTLRPVIDQDLQERERTGQRLQNSLEGVTEPLESSREEYERERPRIEAEQIYQEASPGESYDNGLKRENISQDYFPEEYEREPPRIEEEQIYQEASPGESYDNGIDHESGSWDYSSEEYERERPKTEETQIYGEESPSQRYDDHFVSDAGSDYRSSEANNNRERPRTEEGKTKEEGGPDHSFENDLEADPESAYLPYSKPEAYIDGDTTKLPETVGEGDQERPRIDDTSDEMEKRSSQGHTLRPQSTEEGGDDEKHTRNEDRPETQNMASASYYSEELEVQRAVEEPEGYKPDVDRPNINTELASKRTELPQESIPETSAKVISSKKETSHLKPKTNGKGEMDKIEPKKIQSKRRLFSKKQVDAVNDKEVED